MNFKRPPLEKVLLALALFVFMLVFGIVRAPRLIFADLNPGTNVTSTQPLFWAWNDIIGWMDFHWTHTILVQTHQLTGYASSSAGDISLDCATTRSGNVCGVSNYKVLNNGCGQLSGWGWNDTYGWISFCGGSNTADCPGSQQYQVTIDTGGNFSGYAWNDVVGWISFCGGNNTADCPGTNPPTRYQVVTDWHPTATSAILISNIYDTGRTNSQLNSFIWHGDVSPNLSCPGVNNGATSLQFQFASSNNTSTLTCIGPGNSTLTYYTGNAGVSIPLETAAYHEGRYFRYCAYLGSDAAQQKSPRLDDIIINWSP